MEKQISVCRRLRHLLLQKPTIKTAVSPAATATPTPAPSKIQGKYETLVDTFKKNSSSSGFRAKRSVYKIAVHRLARAGQFSHIDDILQHQKQYPDIKNEYFTTRLIILYGQAKMLDHALQLFDEMPHINCPRTVLSFNSLLAACFPSENLDKVIELFHKLPTELSIEPDVISYTSAIKAFCKKGLFDNAVSLLEEMAAKGVAPNAVTFKFLLTECYHGGMFSEAENAWRLMKEKNVEPNLRCYNSRIQGLVSEKRLSEAIETVKELEQKGLQGCSYTYTYNLLIKGFITEGNVEEVKKWYAALQESSAANAATAPNIFTYMALVPFALDHIGIDFAYQLCKDSVGIKGKLSSTIVKKVIDELLKQSKLHQAQELQQLHKFTVSNV